MLLLEEPVLHALLRNVNTFMHTDDDFPRRSDTTATSSTDMAISIANSSGLDPSFLRQKKRIDPKGDGFMDPNFTSAEAE